MRALLVTSFMLLAAVSMASAQESAAVGPGKFEVGFFPGGGTFFVGGDDNTEADFGMYTFGGGATWYLNSKLAFEGEISGGAGIAQDVVYQGTPIKHRYVPNLRSFGGNIVLFPRGAMGKRLSYYLTGGAGALSLISRDETKIYGYDPDQNPSEMFAATNLGGGMKIFRAADVPQWGFRLDYRLYIVPAKDGAPSFFASEKTRIGHRVYFGLLYTPKR